MDDDKIIEKFAEESAKESIGKIIDRINSFLGSICMPAAEEFGLLLRDKIAYYRLKNFFKIIEKTKKNCPNCPILKQLEKLLLKV
jgi:hypothetical protein